MVREPGKPVSQGKLTQRLVPNRPLNCKRCECRERLQHLPRLQWERINDRTLDVQYPDDAVVGHKWIRNHRPHSARIRDVQWVTRHVRCEVRTSVLRDRRQEPELACSRA